MPYFEGKRVSNAEWRRLRGDKTLTWQEATGYGSAEAPADEPEAVAEEPKRRVRRGSKKDNAEAALAAITGLDINLGDEEEQE